MKALEDEGVDLRCVYRCSDTHTAEAVIAVDVHGENQIMACPGAYNRLNADMIKTHEDSFKWANWVLLQNELPRDAIDEAIKLYLSGKLDNLMERLH